MVIIENANRAASQPPLRQVLFQNYEKKKSLGIIENPAVMTPFGGVVVL